MAAVVLALAPAGPAWAAPDGLTDLGTLGGNFSMPLAVNPAGQMIGYSLTAQGAQHGFVWDAANGMLDLGTFGGDYCYPDAINSAGQVIGFTTTLDDEGRGFIWDAAHGMQDLGTLGGNLTSTRALNASGQVIGFSNTVEGHRHAFIWDKTHGMQDLGTLGGKDSFATAINSAGQVIGYSAIATGQIHAFFWDAASGLKDLGALSGVESYPAGINASGQVVGTIRYFQYSHAFIWDALNGMKDLGALDGTYSFPFTINDDGKVFGNIYHSSGSVQAFIWQDGVGMQGLGDFGGDYTRADAVSASGQVIGVGRAKNYYYANGFFWDPIKGLQNTGNATFPAALNSLGLVVGSLFFSGNGHGISDHAMVWSSSTGLQDFGTLGGTEASATHITDAGQVFGWSTPTPGSYLHERHAFAVTVPAIVLSQANHQMVTVDINPWLNPDHNTRITITGVTQDESTNGLGDGDKPMDAILHNNGTVELRAECSGKGDGRIYRIAYTATNLGRPTSGVVKVSVPHSDKEPAIDNGAQYDSTQ